MSTSCLTQGHYITSMCPNVIFQILLPCSRPMMSHHVTCHMTAMSCASSLSKRKSKGKENKINIKSEKLNKRKEKLSVFKVFHNTILYNQNTSLPALLFLCSPASFFLIPLVISTSLLLSFLLLSSFLQFFSTPYQSSFFLLLYFYSSLLLSLKFISNLVTLSYHFSIVLS